MDYKIFVNNPISENTIVLYDETGEAVVVDCGCYNTMEENALLWFLEEKKLTLVGILNTHLHPDHIFGNRFLTEKFGIEVQASREDEFFIEQAVPFAAGMGIAMQQPPRIGKYLSDGDTVRFGHSELRVIATPGHSQGGLCFYSERDKLLLSGDTLFACSVGRSDLPGGNESELLSSIHTKLFTLPDDVKVIPGHGDYTTIGYEKQHNPFA